VLRQAHCFDIVQRGLKPPQKHGPVVLHPVSERKGEVIEGRSVYILRYLRGQIEFFRASDSTHRCCGSNSRIGESVSKEIVS